MHERISPSRFMRTLRPEYYSDTEDHASYVLEQIPMDFTHSLRA